MAVTALASAVFGFAAGSDSLELYLALRRRGFNRVATTATCRIPKGQHAVGLITGQNSPQNVVQYITVWTVLFTPEGRQTLCAAPSAQS